MRSKDKDDQRQNYSGKKKAHRKKNLLVSGHQRQIVYLGPTVVGKVHDKKLADESHLSFPADTLVLKDTGFQGYTPPGAATLQPRKKPRGREMPRYSAAINRLISGVRVGVEHAIGGVKRCHIVADTFRNWRQGMVDQVMLAAGGLHDRRVIARA